MIEIKPIASSSKGNCYFITDGKTPLLIEAGVSIGTIKRAMNYCLSSIAGCLISHEHGDHSRAVKDIMRFGISCYMSNGTAEYLKLSGHRLKFVNKKEVFTVGSWSIMPFDTVHDAAEPLGFLMASGKSKVLFITDSAYCKYRFTGITHIIIECNHQIEILREQVKSGAVSVAHKNRVMKNHFNLENVIEFLKANDLKNLCETWLIHLSDANSNEKQMLEAVQRVTGKPVYVAGE